MLIIMLLVIFTFGFELKGESIERDHNMETVVSLMNENRDMIINIGKIIINIDDMIVMKDMNGKCWIINKHFPGGSSAKVDIEELINEIKKRKSKQLEESQ